MALGRATTRVGRKLLETVARNLAAKEAEAKAAAEAGRLSKEVEARPRTVEGNEPLGKREENEEARPAAGDGRPPHAPGDTKFRGDEGSPPPPGVPQVPPKPPAEPGTANQRINQRATNRRKSASKNLLQSRFVHGKNERLESAFAKIERQHLGTGTSTNAAARLFARTFGRAKDDAGHAIAKRLGGSGKDIKNIFPQSLRLNRGDFREYEAKIAAKVKAGKEVFVQVILKYDSSIATRPSRIVYVTRVNGETEIKVFLNQ